MLLKRGRWQLHHDWMSTSGGMYVRDDSYWELSFYLRHFDGLSLTVDVLAPVLGDIRMQVQNKQAVAHNKRSPYMRDNPHMTKRVSWQRGSYIDLVRRDLEVRERNRKEAERRGNVLH